MNYIQSVSDFFKSPKWMMNMLLAGLTACFIPIVGPMVVLGWLITGFWCRPNGTPESFPEFDFSNFVKWMERGLWPMLTAMVTSFALYFVFMIPVFIVMAVLGAGASGESSGGGVMAVLMGLVMLVMYLLMILAMIFLMKPIMLKATLTQDFGKSFDFGFIKRFVSLMWMELLISTLFLGVVSFALVLCGMIACCVGLFLVPGVIYFAMVHMDRQLYYLYLSRGGEPIELSPKLNDTPPGLPVQ